MARLAPWCVLITLVLLLTSTAESIDREKIRWMRSKPPPRIDSILIAGNDHFQTSHIKKRMYSRTRTLWRSIKGDRRSRIQRETYGRDTLEIKHLYLSNGFLGIRVDETFDVLPPDSAALVRVTIDEGRRFHYGVTKVTGDYERRLWPSLYRAVNRLQSGLPVNLFDLHQAALQIKTVLANEGYPYANVDFGIDTVAATTDADVTFHIQPDSLVHFGDVRVVGLRRFPEHTARRELRIVPGEVYRRRDIIDSQTRLIESGYFSTLRLNRADTLADRLRPDFVLRVRERKPIYLSVKTGVGQSQVRDLTWDLSAGVGKRNFIGSRRLDLLGELQFGFGRDTRLLIHTYKLRFTEPWFLGIRMPLSLTGKWEPRLKNPVQDFRIETWSVALSTYKYFGREVRTDLGAEYEGVNIFDIPRDQIQLTEEIEDKITVRRKLYGKFRRDSRDDLFIPRRGSLTDLSVEYYGGFLGGEVHFYKWEASWSSYQKAWPGWISATRFKFGAAQEFGSSEVVPVDDRFYLGGANSIRGFKENSLGPVFDDGNPKGADYVAVLNQEFRWRTLQVFQAIPLLKDLFESFPLWQSVFADIGNAFTHIDEFKLNSLAYTYGTGLQLVSPAGPIRVDYARRIKTDKIDFDDRWHFTILYAF